MFSKYKKTAGSSAKSPAANPSARGAVATQAANAAATAHRRPTPDPRKSALPKPSDKEKKRKERLMEINAYSGVIRPVIPIPSGHPFRFDPAGDSGLSGHPKFT